MNAPEPSTRCTRHEDDAAHYPCSACAAAVETREAWTAEHHPATGTPTTRAARAAARVRAGIDGCSLCDTTGHLPNHRVCDHAPDSIDRANRGMAAVRQALTGGTA